MKRFLILVLTLALLGLYSAPLLAAAGPTVGHPMNSVFLTTETHNVVAKGKEIYGYTVYAAAAGSFAFYDLVAITSSATTADIIDEGGEATASDSTTVWYPKPLVTDNGLSVALTGTLYITIYYEK